MSLPYDQEISQLIELGEDSRCQFKLTFENPDSLAAEICAFANSFGGKIIVGVSDKGEIIGVPDETVNRLNQLISNVTTNNIKPALFVETRLLKLHNQRVLVIEVPLGPNKPYEVASGFWVKDGADKRRALREELFRLFQASGSIYADEMAANAPVSEVNLTAFGSFYESVYEEKLNLEETPLASVLQNLKLATSIESLSLAGLMLFGKNPQNYRPQFSIKATYFDGADKSVVNFLDKEEITGTLLHQFERGLAFLSRNLKRIQVDKDFNSAGELEVPEIIVREAIANAIVHRDYFISSPIMLEIYTDRIEIISPGRLPNTLNESNIRMGLHIERNPVILTVLQKMKSFKYSGRGSGIPRMVRTAKEQNIQLEFVNDTATDRFIVKVFKKKGLSASIP